MLLRNLYKIIGLCDEIRFIIIRIVKYIFEGQII
jgi:hypothetical protein